MTTRRVLTVQPSSFIDNLWSMPSGEVVEGTRLPYPLHVLEDGLVLRQDFWKGDPWRVIGFAARVDVHRIDLTWEAAWAEPERAIGMYLVTAAKGGGMGTWQLAVQSVTEAEV